MYACVLGQCVPDDAVFHAGLDVAIAVAVVLVKGVDGVVCVAVAVCV